jgi:hypothetical protein
MDQFLEDAVDVRAVGGFRQLGSEFRDAPGGGPGLGHLDGGFGCSPRSEELCSDVHACVLVGIDDPLPGPLRGAYTSRPIERCRWPTETAAM